MNREQRRARRVPRFERTGIDPGILEDMEPKGWTTLHTPKRFFGYNATNRCCRDWMLLGWPAGEDGRPRPENDSTGRYDGRGWQGEYRMRLDCPKCGDALYFDIPHPDLVIEWNRATMGEPQPPAIVAGRITGHGH